MGLNIIQYDGLWRITADEQWEFKTKAEFEACLKKLIDYKSKHGQIKRA